MNKILYVTVIAILFGHINIVVAQDNNDEEVKNSLIKGIPNYYPNSQYINFKRESVDTIRAIELCNQAINTFKTDLNKGIIRQEKCQSMLLFDKKAKTPEEFSLLRSAYDLCLEIPSSDDISRKMKELDLKDVKKGKITKNVKKYLATYSEYLEDSLNLVQNILSKSWDELIPEDYLPYITETVQKQNPNYRGLQYNNYEKLDRIEEIQQISKKWSFLYGGNYEYQFNVYPEKVNYLTFKEAPQYRVLYTTNYNEKPTYTGVYDSQGNLVYVPSLTRLGNEDEFMDIKRLVYLKDYQSNKYNIQSTSKHTKEYISLFLGRTNGLVETPKEAISGVLGAAIYAGMASQLMSPLGSYQIRNKLKQYELQQYAKYTDNDGKNFLEQLKKDHAEEFGCLYIIERRSDLSFLVVYLDSNAQPSWSAEIAYSTGNKPYTKAFSTKLIKLTNPQDIPPIIRPSNEEHVLDTFPKGSFSDIEIQKKIIEYVEKEMPLKSVVLASFIEKRILQQNLQEPTKEGEDKLRKSQGIINKIGIGLGILNVIGL